MKLTNEIRYALRQILRSPGFSLVVVIVLALGIGGNTAIFSVIDAVLLKPLPYADADRLVALWETPPVRNADRRHASVAGPNFRDWVQNNPLLENAAAYGWRVASLTGGPGPERVRGQMVTGNFFQTLGVQPAQGRAFSAEEQSPGHEHVVIVSDGLWRSRLGSRPDALGQALTIDGQSYMIVGIMPAEFRTLGEFGSSDGVQFWTPLLLQTGRAVKRDERYLGAVARLKPGASVTQVDPFLNDRAAKLAQAYPDTNRGWGAQAVSLKEDVVGNVRRSLYVLLAAAGFVLLITCANVANLLLSRMTARRRELGLRISLGAQRSDLIRSALVYSTMLALLGGLLGIVLAVFGVQLLVAIAPKDIPRLQGVGWDGRVLGFSLGLSLVCGLIFGVLPALRTSRLGTVLPSLNLRQGSGMSTVQHDRMRKVLVVAEIALSVIILTGAGLLIRSFYLLRGIDIGYEAKNGVAVNISPPSSRYPQARQTAAFFHGVLDQVERIPGVRSAAVTSFLPLRGSGGGRFSIMGGGEQKARLDAEFRAVSPGYFAAMGVPLLKGRVFNDRDIEGGTPVAIINLTMAKRFWPGDDPIGKRIKAGPEDSPNPWLTIEGVIGDMRHRGQAAEALAEIYVPYTQFSSLTVRPRELIVRSSDPMRLLPDIRRAVWAADKDQALSDVRSLAEDLSNSISQPRFNTVLLSCFGGLGLVLAGLGVFGVMSYSVAQRVQEIGVRVALGARPVDVLKMIIGQALRLIAIGLVAGLAGALALTRVMSSLLFGVSASDPLTFAAVAVTLVLTGLMAAYLPTHRALSLDPGVALRWE